MHNRDWVCGNKKNAPPLGWDENVAKENKKSQVNT